MASLGSQDNRDGLAVLGRPRSTLRCLQRRTFSMLRVSGPSLLDSGSGAGMTEGKGRHETCACG